MISLTCSSVEFPSGGSSNLPETYLMGLLLTSMTYLFETAGF